MKLKMNYLMYKWIQTISLVIIVAGVVNTEHMLTDKYRSMVYHTTLNTSAPVYHSHPPQPYFLSKRQQFKIKIGQDVTFPCHVNNKGKDVITWKTADRLLTAGPIKVYNEDRLIHRYNGSEIMLRDVQPRDVGDYSCQLNSIDHAIELVHHLDVLIPPRVVARESEVSVRSGSSAELECVAHGNPPPTIRWRKLVGVSSDTSVISSDTNQKNNRNKQTGQSLGEGSRLRLERVSRDDGGDYECLASNGVEEVGEVISSVISLTVHYHPQVKVSEEKRVYHPKLKQDHLMISCNVSADPSPDVNWQRGRVVLSTHDTKNKYQMSSFPLDGAGNTRQFVLTIKNIREEDYGNYTCLATNSLGMDKQEIIVSGKPLPPLILPGTLSHGRQGRSDYRLRWRIDSAFPVREHNIYYERIVETETGTICDGDGDCANCGGRSDSCNMINVRVDQKHHQKGWRRPLDELQTVLDNQRDAEQTLHKLITDARYKVKIQTVNEFGKSRWSKDYEFDTFKIATQRPSLFSAFSNSPNLMMMTSRMRLTIMILITAVMMI